MTPSTRELAELVGTSGREVVLVSELPEPNLRDMGTVVDRALQQPTAREVASAYLHGAVRVGTRSDARHRRPTSQGAVAASPARRPPDRASVVAPREEAVIHIADRLQRAHEEGDLPLRADPGLLARFLVTVLSGLAVQAGGGSGRAELHSVADVALRAVPPRCGTMQPMFVFPQAKRGASGGT